MSDTIGFGGASLTFFANTSFRDLNERVSQMRPSFGEAVPARKLEIVRRKTPKNFMLSARLKRRKLPFVGNLHSKKKFVRGQRDSSKKWPLALLKQEWAELREKQIRESKTPKKEYFFGIEVGSALR